MQDRSPRRKKIIQPRFQLMLIGKFVGLAALAMVLQFLLLGYLLAESLADTGSSGSTLYEALPSVIVRTLAFSLLVLMPLLFGFGVLLTSRIAGPLYRCETYLRALARGEAHGPCRIRKGDELQSLCDAINEVSSRIGVDAEESGAPPSAQPRPLREAG